MPSPSDRPPAEKTVTVLVVDDEPAGEGERVFDAFFRGERSRGEDGAGLGLAISRAIVEAHGGHIWLEDVHPGTRVRFTLPA